jgi:polysaccharide export outer membrane protein
MQSVINLKVNPEKATKHMKLKAKIYATIAAMTLMMGATSLSSCSSNKTVLPYFTDLSQEGSVEQGSYTVTIVPDDELLINVSAEESSAVDPFTIPFQRQRVSDFNEPTNIQSQVQTRRGNSLTYMPYKVNREGFINFPVLGQIHVEGLTLSQLADYLTQKISLTVKDPIVSVELTNFHVNVMGEVTSPGSRLVNRERYSILDAISDAGDLTPYGERSSVLLIREENGQRTYHRLNLNSGDLLSSPYFYLKQNDVVYVEPNNIRQANAKVDQDKSFKLSMTSVIVSAASVVASLIIALVAN